MKKYLFGIYGLLIYCLAIAQSNDNTIITKRFFSVEDGMAARDVRCAVQDKDGFMWFGTSNGLNRFDGKTFKLYNSANTGLSNNSIKQLAIDDQNNLIIIYENVEGIKATIDSRIQVLDLSTNELKSLKKVYNHLPFDVNKIYWIANDETKSLNFLTYNNFTWWKYNAASGFDKQYEFKEKNQNLAFESNMYAVYGSKSVFRSNKAAIVLNEHSGFLVTKDTALLISKPIPITDDKLKRQMPDYAYYNSVLEKNKNDHQYLVDKEVKVIEQDKISFTDFVDIASVNDASSLFYIEQKGIYLQTKQSVKLLFTPDELKDFFEFTLSKNYVDRLGNRWICTNVGVLEVTIRKNHFTHYFEHSKTMLSSTSNQTRGLYVDESVKGDTSLYANVYFDLLIHQHQKDALKKGIEGINYAILYQKEGIYIGANRLMKYLPESGTFLPIDTAAYAEIIWSLFRYSDNILLAGYANGINSYDLHSGKRTMLIYASSNMPKVKNVYKIFISPSKGLIAVAENGIYCIDNKLQIVDYYGKEARDQNHKLPIATINDLLEDKQGVCWIASDGEGLFKWKWNTNIDADNSIKCFTMTDGLPSLVLYRIEQDDQDNLWIGTYNGLLRFDPHSNTSMVYTVKDGLTTNEFNRISSYKSTSGGLYFGSMNGVNAFLPKDLNSEIESVDIPFKLTNISKFSTTNNSLVDCLLEFKQDQKIILSVGEKFLSVAFSLLDFQQRIHHYAYKIDGFDKDWNILEDGSLRISGLPAGEYTLRIKAQLENGRWNKNEITIPLLVLKPFYLHGWFVVLCMLLLLVLVLLYSYFRTRMLKADKLGLEQAVIKITEELQKIMGDKDLLLAEIHHRVKNNLQVISGLLQLQSNSIEDETLKKAFQEGENRVNSIALIHENLYRHEAIGTINFHEFVKDLVGKLAELLAIDNQFIKFNIGEEKILLNVDTVVSLGLIVNELVTNAHKFLPKNNKENNVSITLNEVEAGEFCLLYKDNGSGISGGIDFATANSLGLKIINGLSNQLNGCATYKYKEGTEILIEFKSKQQQKKKSKWIVIK